MVLIDLKSKRVHLSFLFVFSICSFFANICLLSAKIRIGEEPFSKSDFEQPQTQKLLGDNNVSSNEEHKDSRQRVILLAGPHKTASSSIQQNMLMWLNDKEDYFGTGLAKNWAWPSPISTFRKHGCNLSESKIFYPWIHALSSLTERRENTPCADVYSREEMIGLYKKEFEEWWRKGYSLVIASEAMDLVPRVKYSGALLQNIIHQQPWYTSNGNRRSTFLGKDDDITVVVNYRSPRSSHLISSWHQCCMTSMSFHDYLLSLKESRLVLDSLRLAKICLDQGLRVVLVDMAGVTKNDVDISNVIACDVLGAECTKQKHFLNSKQERSLPGAEYTKHANFLDSKDKTIVANVKTHSNTNLNVTDDQVKQIDAVIRRYDCNFVSLIENEKFQILYAYAIQEVFDQCKTNGGEELVTSRKDMVQRIISIAKNTSSSTSNLSTKKYEK
jgi:hypothetical protein